MWKLWGQFFNYISFVIPVDSLAIRVYTEYVKNKRKGTE